jgi:hypothetical protein
MLIVFFSVLAIIEAKGRILSHRMRESSRSSKKIE